MRRVVGTRRAHAKRPHHQYKINQILSLYANDETGERKWPQQEGNDSFHDPAPHPTRGTTTPWKTVIEAAGPIGLMIQAIYGLGARLDRKFRIHAKNETPLDILQTPFQHLGKLLMEHAARA